MAATQVNSSSSSSNSSSARLHFIIIVFLDMTLGRFPTAKMTQQK